MALTKDQKTAQVTALRDTLKKSKSLVFMNYLGLSVAEVDELRGNMDEKDAQMRVAKKTLYGIAAKEEGFPEVPEDVLDGPVAFVFSFEDEMSGAKVAYEFGKKHKAVKLLGGVMNGKVLSQEEALDLAKMLSHDEMLAKFAMMLRAPLTNFAGMCGSPLGSFARAAKELAEKREKEAPVPVPVEEAKAEEAPKEEVAAEPTEETSEKPAEESPAADASESSKPQS